PGERLGRATRPVRGASRPRRNLPSSSARMGLSPALPHHPRPIRSWSPCLLILLPAPPGVAQLCVCGCDSRLKRSPSGCGDQVAGEMTQGVEPGVAPQLAPLQAILRPVPVALRQIDFQTRLQKLAERLVINPIGDRPLLFLAGATAFEKLPNPGQGIVPLQLIEPERLTNLVAADRGLRGSARP